MPITMQVLENNMPNGDSGKCSLMKNDTTEVPYSFEG